MSYYDHINNAEKYLCDRCNFVELNEEQYDNHKRPIENSDDVSGIVMNVGIGLESKHGQIRMAVCIE